MIMKKIFLAILMSLVLISCNNSNHSSNVENIVYEEYIDTFRTDYIASVSSYNHHVDFLVTVKDSIVIVKYSTKDSILHVYYNDKEKVYCKVKMHQHDTYSNGEHSHHTAFYCYDEILEEWTWECKVQCSRDDDPDAGNCVIIYDLKEEHKNKRYI